MFVKCLKARPNNINKLINKLKELKLLNKDFKVFKEEDFIFIPLSDSFDERELNKIIEEFKKRENIFVYGVVDKDLKLKKKNEIEELEVKSFDLIGDIAITIIPKGLENKKFEIGRKIAKLANVKTVLAEKNARSGEFRLQEFECIFGEDKRETIYKENKCRFLVNVEKVYFSPRLSTDRLEIAKEIKEGENVLVMFSGIQPYPIVISKNSKANLIIGIEKNPEAFYYSLKNIEMNKLYNVISFIGDVRDVLPLNKRILDKFNNLKTELLKEKEKKKSIHLFTKEFNKFKVISPFELDEKEIVVKNEKERFLFDRIIMPLPKGSELFLDLALESIKDNGVIHWYQFAKEEEFEDLIKKAKEIARIKNKKLENITIKKVGQIRPRTWRIRINFKVKYA